MRRLSDLLNRRRREGEIERELRFHIGEQIQAHIRAGLSLQEAVRRTRLEFGGLEQVKEECRDVFLIRWCEDLVRDARMAVRGFRGSPAFFLTTVATLAVGIGANTAMFALMNSLALRPLPVRDPARLAVLVDPAPTDQMTGLAQYSWSYPLLNELQQRPELFDGLAAWSTSQFNLSSGGETQFVNGLWTNGRFFETLGVAPALGRLLGPADDSRAGGAHGPVAVLSYEFWERRYGGASSAIGSVLTLERVPFTIVGVMPPTFLGAEVGRTFDVAVPFGTEALLYGRETRLDQRNRSWLYIMARLKPGQTLAAATSALRAIQPQLRQATVPLNWTTPQQAKFMMSPLTLETATTGLSGLRRRYERPLAILMIVVALLLLIACVNIASLLLARASARAHEMSARRALGASRGRLVRQLLTESALLSITGAVGGLLIAAWGSRFLAVRLAAPPNTPSLDLSLDGHVVAFTTVIAVVTTILFGGIPALRASRAVPMDALKDETRSIRTGGPSVGVRSLVVAQVAVSLLLIVTAGLLIRTFVVLVGHDRGFDASRVLVVDINAQRADIEASRRIPVFELAKERVDAMPGIASAGLSLMSPVRGERLGNLIQSVSGGVPLPDTLPLDRRRASINLISPGWFDALRIPLVAGRDFTSADRKGAPLVAVVNESFGRKFLGGTSPLGHTVTLAFTGTQPMTAAVVGVVADAVYSSLRDSSLETMYFPLPQHDDFPFLAAVRLSIRSNGPLAASLTRSVAAAIAEASPQLALTFRPLSEQVDASVAQERLVASLSALFGGLALLLTGLGLYGVTSYGVSRRRTEIGVRMALGATSANVVRLVVSEALLLVIVGVVAGALLSAWGSTFVATLLYDVTPHDPLTFVAAAAVLIAAALVAACVPARRAARLDPAVTLRCN